MEQIKTKIRFWQIFALATLVVILAAAVCWSLNHPYGIHWDEAQYLNEAAIDTQRLQAGFLLKCFGRILLKSWGRPPAYRLFAVPVLALLGFRTATARLVTLACFALTAWFIYLATKRIASPVAGAFAVLVFCVAPQVVSASIWFSSEGPLYLATSAMLYYLFATWTDTSERSRNWIGLGLAVGLGLLSKTSFILIGLPVLAFALAIDLLAIDIRKDRWKHFSISRLSPLLKAGIVALLVAGPWWVMNARAAFGFAKWARSDVRFSLGPASVGTWTRWFSAVLQGLLGHGVSLIIALVVLACFYKAIVRKETILDPLQKKALGACVFAALPLVLSQLFGVDYALRLISAVVIPIAIVVGVLADNTGWARRTVSVAISSLLFFVQLVMIVWPVLSPNNHLVGPGLFNIGVLPWRVMARADQWDWRPVLDISHNCGVEDPRISYLGNGQAFDLPQIEYPWAIQALSTGSASVHFPVVTWLWRYEEGPIDWQKVMGLAEQSDIVVTAPGFVGRYDAREDLDNQHNAELSDRLSKDPGLTVPIHIKMGRFEPVDVLVFVNKKLTCQPQGQAQVSR
jgi:4-amino-4-deoxy-L-arabinose transferase-like glycosyltransferase